MGLEIMSSCILYKITEYGSVLNYYFKALKFYEILTHRGGGGQNWVELGPRKCWMIPKMKTFAKVCILKLMKNWAHTFSMVLL